MTDLLSAPVMEMYSSRMLIHHPTGIRSELRWPWLMPFRYDCSRQGCEDDGSDASILHSIAFKQLVNITGFIKIDHRRGTRWSQECDDILAELGKATVVYRSCPSSLLPADSCVVSVSIRPIQTAQSLFPGALLVHDRV